MRRKRDSWKRVLALLVSIGTTYSVSAAEIQTIEAVIDNSRESISDNNSAHGSGLSEQGIYGVGTNFEIILTLIGGSAESTDSNVDASALGIGITNLGNSIKTGNNIISVHAIGGSAEASQGHVANLVANVSAGAYGIMTTGGGTTDTGDNMIHVIAKAGSVVGEDPMNRQVSAGALGISNRNGTTTTGNNIIIVQGTTSDNVSGVVSIGGIDNVGGSIHTGSNSISVSANGMNDVTSIGIGVDGGEISTKGAQIIYTKASNGEGNASEARAYALLALSGTVTLDSQGEVVQLTGDIGSTSNGSITVSLDRTDSYWRPRFQGEYLSLGVANGSFGGGNFAISDGGTLDLAWSANQGGAKFLDNHLILTGGNITIAEGATFIINSDLANNAADRVTAAEADVSGIQYVQVAYDPSHRSNEDVFGRALVLDFEGANGQGVRALTEFGLENVYITPVMDGGYLVALLRDRHVSELGMTVSEIYQHQVNILSLQGGSLMRRLGDVRRDDPEKHHNVWARTYGGKLKSESAYGRNTSQKYHGVQAGLDYLKESRSGTYLYGVLLDYLDSDSNFSRGEGAIESFALGGYVTWQGRKGHYADVVLKAAHMDIDYRLHSVGGEKISADLSNWGYSLGMEYGYRKELSNNTFVVPQGGLLFGHLRDQHYATSNGVRLHQDDVNLAIGRLGVLYGVEFGRGEKSNAYVKGSVVHDFSSSGNLTGAYNGQHQILDIAGDAGTSFELNLGANWELSNQNHLYAELTKSFGGNVEIDWQVNFGWRMNW